MGKSIIRKYVCRKGETCGDFQCMLMNDVEPSQAPDKLML